MTFQGDRGQVGVWDWCLYIGSYKPAARILLALDRVDINCEYCQHCELVNI